MLSVTRDGQELSAAAFFVIQNYSIHSQEYGTRLERVIEEVREKRLILAK
jgi:hypothetical protein